MQPRNQALANMGYAWRIIVATRAASIIAAALVLIGSISQFRDVIRFLLEQKAPGGLLALCVSSAALSLALWYSARVLIYQIEPELMLNQTARLKLQLKSAHSDYVVCWANNYPRLLGLAPFVALLIGSWTSMAVNQWQIWLFRGIVMALGIVIYVFEYLRRQLYLKNDDEERDLASLTRKKETAGTAVPLTTTELRKALIIIVTANVLMSILMLCTVCTKGHWAVYMGTIPTMFSALAFLVIFTSGITFGSAYLKLPIGLILIVLAIIFSACSCNDNHAVCRLTVPKAPSMDVGDSFSRWLQSRADKDLYTNGYPVILVSAEGGGIRAAYNTAMVLGAFQDADPRFAQHVFCISGVSGGSVGATLFAQLCAVYATNSINPPSSPPFRSKLDQLLRDDWLAPAMSMLLFTDLPQEFLPFAIPPLDRARALDSAMERSWNHGMPNLPRYSLTNSFRKMADGFESNAIPALFLNSTHVESGQRIIITPFKSDPTNGILTINDVDPTLDIKISTAAFLSARFPIVSPAALISNGIHVVDGGVFENSACTTILDIDRILRKQAHKEGLRARFIFLRIDTVDDLPSISRGPEQSRFSMIVPPLTAFFESRDARAKTAVFDVDEQEHFFSRTNYTNVLEYRRNVVTNIYEAPLGWTLSTVSRSNIIRAYGLDWPVGGTNQLAACLRTNLLLTDVYNELKNTRMTHP